MVISKFNHAWGESLGEGGGEDGKKPKERLEWSDEQNKTKSVVIWQPNGCQLLARSSIDAWY